MATHNSRQLIAMIPQWPVPAGGSPQQSNRHPRDSAVCPHVAVESREDWGAGVESLVTNLCFSFG